MRLTRREWLRMSGAAFGSAALGAALRPGGVAPDVARAFAAGPKAAGGFVYAQSSEFHEINPQRELWSDDSSFHFALFDSLELPDEVQAKIFRGNAIRLLKLKDHARLGS